MDDQAKQVYETIIAFLEKKGRSYHRDDDKLNVLVDGHTDDGTPYTTLASINENCPRVTLITHFASIPEEKIVTAAFAVAMTNLFIADGRIDLSLQNPNLRYVISHYYGDLGVSEDIVRSLFLLTDHTTNKYYTRFSDFADGKIDIYQFMESYND